MQTYSQRHDDDDINEDVFDDNTNHQINHSSSDIKLRRTSKTVLFFSLKKFFFLQGPDSSNFPILHRALSTVSANQTLVNNQRNALAKNFRRISVNDEIVTIDHNDADTSFLLPHFSELPDDIRTHVMDSLVDTPTMATLEETSIDYPHPTISKKMNFCFLERLNWWTNKKLPCPKLYPLLTSGDGNCLLHATSLGMLFK